MNQLEKALEIADQTSLKGPARQEALEKFRKQIAEWGIAIPDVDLLVWDFGLKDFYDTGLIEIWLANEVQAGYCAKYLFLFDGQTCPMHGHKTKTETFFVVKGAIRMECEGTVAELKPGDLLPMPAGKKHEFTGAGPAFLLEISTPCLIDDNFFVDSRVPFGGNYKPQSP